MEFIRGMIVRSNAGHDKGSFFVIIHIENNLALIADGKYRPLSKPKKKKLIHLSKTNTVVPQERLNQDSDIRCELKLFIRAAGSSKGGD